MSLIGQPLIYSQAYPDWIRGASLSRSDAVALVEDHIAFTMGRFRGQIPAWVVVNEFHPLSWASVRDDPLRRALGDELLDIAFQAARDADPNAILIYNDNANHAKSGQNVFDYAAYANTRTIVDRLRRQELLDGVGLQMHLDGSTAPPKATLADAMQSYGVPAYVTELDVNMRRVTGSQEERFARQATVFRDVFEAGIDSGACRSFTFFTVGDRYSWLETDASIDGFSADADPTIFDENLKPKPAHTSILEVLRRAAG